MVLSSFSPLSTMGFSFSAFCVFTEGMSRREWVKQLEEK